MRPVLFAIFLLLMLLGNSFALYKLFTDKAAFLSQFPRLGEKAFMIFRFLPVINIIAIAGLWWMQSWAAVIAIACGVLVISFDLYFGIYYHLYVAIPSGLLMLFFIVKYWNAFK